MLYINVSIVLFLENKERKKPLGSKLWPTQNKLLKVTDLYSQNCFSYLTKRRCNSPPQTSWDRRDNNLTFSSGINMKCFATPFHSTLKTFLPETSDFSRTMKSPSFFNKRPTVWRSILPWYHGEYARTSSG